MASPLQLAVGPRPSKRGLFTNFYICVLLITRLLRLVGRLGSRKPVKPHQLGGYRYPS